MKNTEETDFFGFDKESSKTQNEMWGVALFAVIAAVLVFFFLPAVVISVVITYLLKRKLPKRIEFLIFISFSIFLVIGFSNYGYLPLLQFASIWNAVSEPIVSTMSKLVQNGQPFEITTISYLMLFLTIGTLTGLFLLLYRRLSKTWIVNEKEDKKKAELDSDKFKKFFENRSVKLEKEQTKYRNSSDTAVFLGLNLFQKKVLLDYKDFFTHCLIQGTTGSGKSTLMYSILEGALRNGLGSVYIDGKGDPKTEKEIQSVVEAYGKKLVVFSDRSNMHYNPVRYGKATAIKDRLMAVMDWSESFYEKESENMLQMIINFLQDYIEVEKTRENRPAQGDLLRMDLETIHRFLDLNEIGNYLFLEQAESFIKECSSLTEKEATGQSLTKKDLPSVASNNSLHEKYIRYFFKKSELTYGDLDEIAEMKGEAIKLIRGLRTQIELLIYSDLGDKFIELENPQMNLDILQELKDGNVILLSFNSNDYSSFIKGIGRFVISDIAHCVTKLYGSNDEFKGAIGFFDEFGSYASEKIIDILSKARSALFGAVLGIQSHSDLITPTMDLRARVIDNVNIFLLGRTNYAENAELSSKTAGTYEDIDKTIMTENKGGMFNRWETKGERGTVRNVHKFWFDPDEVKDMPNWTFLLVDKTKNSLEPIKEKVFARNPLAGL